MLGMRRRAAALAAIAALGVGAMAGTAGATTTHHSSGTAAATTTSSTTKPTAKARASAAHKAKSARDEAEARAMVLREKRGPGSPREERGESRSMRQTELRRHAEVRTHSSGGSSSGTKGASGH
jgi:hypothetical protein